MPELFELTVAESARRIREGSLSPVALMESLLGRSEKLEPSLKVWVTMDDKLAKALKETAHRSGKSFKEVVNETLRAGLTAGGTAPRARPYRLKPVSLGGVRSGYDLDKALQLADRIEDQEITRKLQMKK